MPVRNPFAPTVRHATGPPEPSRRNGTEHPVVEAAGRRPYIPPTDLENRTTDEMRIAQNDDRNVTLTLENIILIGALLLFVSVLAGKLASRFRAPALLLFLGVGMFFGLHLISFNSPVIAQFVGSIALSVILFSGGMDTRWNAIRPVLGAGVVLATAGVLLTALILAGLIVLVSPWCGVPMSFMLAMLCASTMASTDSASVFSILGSRRQGLRENLRPLLELESGSNDPMAYMLTVLMVDLLSPGETANLGHSILLFAIGMTAGALAGYLFGKIAVWFINKLDLENPSLYSVLLLAFVFLTFSLTNLVYGNGYLAVYIAGLVVGNRPLAHKRSLTTFFDGFTWLFQIILFVTLGLLVNSEDLFQPEVMLTGTLIGLFMIFVARPIAVGLCLLPFRKFSARARSYISWVGLRGAVPIIFVTYPVVAGIEGAELLFNIVFFVTLLSLVLQGTTVSWAADKLDLSYEQREPVFNEEVLSARFGSSATELHVDTALLRNGDRLKDICLPPSTLVVTVARDGNFFVPKGDTILLEGDTLLVISENRDLIGRPDPANPPANETTSDSETDIETESA